MDKVFFSIIMPTYNTPESYLRSAIESILNQTFTNFEFIIIDDGSTTSPKDLVMSYGDSRIRFIQNTKNMGVAATLNRGIDLATGKYIVRMDSDDISHKNRLAQSHHFIKNNPKVDIFGTDRKNIGASSKTKSHPTANEEIRATLLYTTPFTHPTMVMKKSTIDNYNLRYDANKKAEDYDLWVQCALNKDIIFGNIPQRLLKYRIHENQVTRINNDVNNNAEIVSRDLFNSLGIDVTRNAFQVYIDFVYSKRPLDISDFNIVDNFISDIYNDRKYVRITTEKAFLNVMHEKYAKECIRQQFKYKKFVKNSYSKSKLSGTGKLSPLYRLTLSLLELISTK